MVNVVFLSFGKSKRIKKFDVNDLEHFNDSFNFYILTIFVLITPAFIS